MKKLEIKNFNEFSFFFWLLSIIVIGVFLSAIYLNNSNDKEDKFKAILENTYFKKTIKEITNSFQPRYYNFNYTSKTGDTYEGIISDLKINTNEKKLLIDAILGEKSLKVLKINQKFSFKFDRLSSEQIIEFKIQTDKKMRYFSKLKKHLKLIG